MNERAASGLVEHHCERVEHVRYSRRASSADRDADADLVAAPLAGAGEF
jgi:hypothetical protein